MPSNILIPRQSWYLNEFDHDLNFEIINHLHYICRTRTCSERGGSISAGRQAKAREWQAETGEWGAKTRKWGAKKTTPQESRWHTLNTLFVPPSPLPTFFLFSCDNPNVHAVVLSVYVAMFSRFLFCFVPWLCDFALFFTPKAVSKKWEKHVSMS